VSLQIGCEERARTRRLSTAGIATELLDHREKIEVTRHGSPCPRSPVPMGCAHCHYTRAVCADWSLNSRWRSRSCSGTGKLVGPERRRRAVAQVRGQYRITERHACRLLGQWRGSQRYLPTQRPDEDGLNRAIIKPPGQTEATKGSR